MGSHTSSTIETFLTIARSSLEKPLSNAKKRGTRSVSNLTPEQLAHKRAKDREAQRAKRAQTKKYVAGLKSELQDLKSKQSREQTVQELQQRNNFLEGELKDLKSRCQALEELLRRKQAFEPELSRLNEQIVLLVTTLTSSTGEAVYDDNLNTSTGAIRSPRASPPPPEDYDSISTCSSWANAVPVPPNVFSQWLPANADDIKIEYDNVYHHDASFGFVNLSEQGALNTDMQLQQQQPQQQQQQQQHQHPAWNMYPVVYYPQAQ